MVLLAYLSWSFLITTFENSDHYIEAALITVVAVPVLLYAPDFPFRT